MCGIVGVVSVDQSVRVDDIVAMRDTVTHRGPDDAGVWVSADRRVGLGHTRLSIIDLSPLGHQPMTNEDGSVWLVFNGEIYNFQQLRNELARAGHAFRSATDTEVIIHGYEEWGVRCIDRLRGMFAFALWDGKRRQLLLARDRFGIKPLFYREQDGRVAFASELKGLTSLPGPTPAIDETAIIRLPDVSVRANTQDDLPRHPKARAGALRRGQGRADQSPCRPGTCGSAVVRRSMRSRQRR